MDTTSWLKCEPPSQLPAPACCQEYDRGIRSRTVERTMISAEYDRLLRLKEVMRVTGLGRNTIYRRMREGTFPRQVRIGPNSVAWLQSDISAWMSALKPDP